MGIFGTIGDTSTWIEYGRESITQAINEHESSLVGRGEKKLKYLYPLICS
jgi:hypothetical protein